MSSEIKCLADVMNVVNNCHIHPVFIPKAINGVFRDMTILPDFIPLELKRIQNEIDTRSKERKKYRCELNKIKSNEIYEEMVFFMDIKSILEALEEKQLNEVKNIILKKMNKSFRGSRWI